MEQRVFKGKIWTGEFGEDSGALFIGYNSTPVAKIFDREFYGKKVTIRYWISTKEMEKQELQEEMIAMIAGSVHASYYDHYSEYTGYLGTVAEAKIGGHNLLHELYSNKEKFIYMEVDY